MLNMIRADLYRILREKAVYITFGIFALIFVLLGGAYAIGIKIGIHTGEAMIVNNFTGMSAPFAMMALMDFLIYFMLILIIVTISDDFSSGSIKNVLSAGISRTKYYISKLMTALFMCAVLTCFSIIFPILIGSIVNGFGGIFSIDYIISLLQPVGAQFFLLTAVTCIGTFIAFWLKNTVAVNAVYLAFFLIPSIITSIIAEFGNWIEDFEYFHLIKGIKIMANISSLPNVIVIKTLIAGAIYIAASTMGGILIFNKSEIK